MGKLPSDAVREKLVCCTVEECSIMNALRVPEYRIKFILLEMKNFR